MLVFIGLILVYGLLFAILAVSKAILDKDKNRLLPPKAATRKAAAESQRIPLRPFQSSGVPRWTKMRGFSCKAAKACSKAGKAFSQVCKAPTDVSRPGLRVRGLRGARG